MFSVLIADDDRATIELVTTALESVGLSPDVAQTRREAFANFDVQPYDLLLLEMLLPEMDGVETIITVRHHWPRCRIIAMTGGGRFLDTGEALSIAKAVGADAALAKPFTAARLFGTLAGLLSPAVGAA